MFNKLEKYQINGNIVGSVSGFQVDNSDPENVVILETANIDGSNTIGGVWWIDRILSDRFTGEKQVLHAISDDTLEVGNNDLEEVYLLGKSVNSFKVKYGSNIEQMWHSGNLVYVSQLENDANYAYNDGGNATGDLQETIAWKHVHWNEGILNNINVAFTYAEKDAYDAKLDVEDLDGFVYNVTYTSNTHVLTFYRQNQPNIVIDLPIEQLIKGVQLVGNDLVFTFEDGSTVTVPMNTLLVGVVKKVNGLAPNSQGEIVLNISDIPGLTSELNQIGALSTLTTTNKNNLVDAINEVKSKSESSEARNYAFVSNLLENNVTVSNDANGTYIEGSTAAFYQVYFTDHVFEPNTTYTLFFRGYAGNTTQRFIIHYTDGTNDQLFFTTSLATRTMLTPANKTVSYISFTYGSGTAVRLYNLLFVKGSTFPGWVPAPEDQVSDWNETNPLLLSYIKNKPTIPTIPTNYITTNTNQTGLTGNKTTSGIITSTGGFVGDLTGNATTASTLATSRTINGTSFNGSANIVTSYWGTARNITIGNTTKSVNGSANVAWSLAEIGAASQGSLGNYVNRAGDTMTGNLGIGVTPSQWSHRNVIQIGQGGSVAASNDSNWSDNIDISANAYISSGVSTYIKSGYAQMYRQERGNHIFNSAISGNAGQAISWAEVFRINLNGNATLLGNLSIPNATANNHAVAFGQLANYAQLSQVYTQSQSLALFVGLNGVQTIADTKTFSSSPVVPNATLNGHAVNLGQLNTILGDYATETWVNSQGFSTQTLTAGSNISIVGNVISAVDTNTTYTAGAGLSLTGTVFGQTITTSGTGTFVTGITQTTNGFQINLGTPVIPTMSSTVVGGAKLYSDAVQNVPVQTVTYIPNRTYAVQFNPDKELVVNVPWTNTTYSAGTGLSLSGTTFGQTITTSGTGTFVTGITQTTNGFQVNLGTPPNNTYTAGDNITINGNVISATNTTYVLPTASTTTKGGVNLYSNTVQPNYPQGVTSDAGRTFAVQLDALGRAVVNVPAESIATSFYTINTTSSVPNTNTNKIIQCNVASSVTITLPSGQFNGQKLKFSISSTGGGASGVKISGSLRLKGSNISITDNISLGGLDLYWNATTNTWWIMYAV